MRRGLWCWMVGAGLLACGDSGTGSASAGSTSGASTGTAGESSTGVDPTSGAVVPTSGGSQSASGTTSGTADDSTSTTAGGESTGGTTAGVIETSTTSSSTSGADETTGAGETTSGGGDTTGGPTCQGSLVLCGDTCVDIDADELHCGGCDMPCPDEFACDLGQCLPIVCEPKMPSTCYTGGPGTKDVGLCKGGARVCNDLGTQQGPCIGEVVPVAEDCEVEADEDCDGKVDEECFLANCAAIKLADPEAGDDDYKIDLDGDDGPIKPFVVRCDMTTQGGGWTRFNWLHTEYTPGQDPLGQLLQDCKVADLQCRGRIPAGAVKDLLVKDLTDKTHAMWTFNGGTISNAVLAALQSKVQYCAANQGAFNPVVNTSPEPYCGNGQEGGCDSFFYTSGGCNNVGNWGIHWDGDGAWCAAAFKMGATYSGCGNHGDQGFLNDCACDDEQGELYYR